MKNIRQKFERFCYNNRTKGIPNLMLYVTIGTALVYLMSLFDNSYTLYTALCFNRELILQGQVWRLFTFVFVYDAGHILITAIVLFCYYTLGRAMESLWGTFRFNLFYFTGVVLMDVFCLLIGGQADITYLNMSLFLGYATMYPQARFLFLYFIPVKAWIFGIIDLALTAVSVISMTAAGLFPYSLFPLVAIGNYFLFFGKDVKNLFPSFRPRPRTAQKVVFKTVPLRREETKPSYNHRCTVCGRTDVSDPDMEFRYCSRCNGYFCYCQEHISNHSHVE